MIASRSERSAWRSLLLVPVIGLLVAVRGLITGAPGNPALVGALTGLDWEQLRAQQPGMAQLVSVVNATNRWRYWGGRSGSHGRTSRASGSGRGGSGTAGGPRPSSPRASCSPVLAWAVG